MKFFLAAALAITPLHAVEISETLSHRITDQGLLKAGTQFILTVEKEHYRLTILSPKSASPFWKMSEIRPPINRLSTSAPVVTLISEIGTTEEKRYTVSPQNISRRKQGYEFSEDLKIPLKAGDQEVGHATLFCKQGAIYTHIAVYTLNRKQLSGLGEEFLVISGNPLIQKVGSN